jgi:hypothetical protein
MQHRFDSNPLQSFVSNSLKERNKEKDENGIEDNHLIGFDCVKADFSIHSRRLKNKSRILLHVESPEHWNCGINYENLEENFCFQHELSTELFLRKIQPVLLDEWRIELFLTSFLKNCKLEKNIKHFLKKLIQIPHLDAIENF